jgi:hypothetical protein
MRSEAQYREAVQEVLGIVDARAAAGMQVSAFRRIFNGYHSARHMHIGTRDSPLGVCYRKEEIADGSGRWMVFARFDTLEVLEWCLKELTPCMARRQKELFL